MRKVLYDGLSSTHWFELRIKELKIQGSSLWQRKKVNVTIYKITLVVKKN